MSISIHKYDVVIIGSGLAGCAAARELQQSGKSVCVLTKLHPLRSHSGAAQGGINAALSDDDEIDLHIFDTVKGSDYLGDQDAIELMCNSAPETIRWIETMGATFSRKDNGTINQRPFGGQSKPRACFAKDRTGLTLLQTIYEQANRAGVKFLDEWYVSDIIYKDGVNRGVVAYDLRSSEFAIFQAKAVMFATGGYGRCFDINSNAHANTGDGLSVVARRGIPLEDMEFVQFHPTGLAGTGILISEAARGEGGKLLNSKGERFMEKYAPEKKELASRDVVSRAIKKELLEGRGVGPDKNAVYIDLTHLGADLINSRLPELRELAIAFLGLDMIKEPILITPTAHYSMGGIPVDTNGRVRKNPTEFTKGLYAAGECACVSVHGANRLGANSLLEALFFGRYVGKSIIKDLDELEFHDVSEDDAKDAINEFEFIRTNNGDYRVPKLRKELQVSMDINAGVFRTKESLTKQIVIIKQLREQYKDIRIDDKSKTYNIDLQEAIEFGHMLDYSIFIVEGGLLRQESRGAHFRDDFPNRDDDKFMKHSYGTMDQDGNVTLEYSDTVTGKLKPEIRSY
jgi:succinate dehydrogenase / fumarate reductase flavoprotein subunit